MISPRLAYVLLFVESPEKSADFYSKIFGGIKPVELSSTFALFILENGVKLGLWSKNTAEPEVTARPGAMELSFNESDVDKVYQQFVGMEVPILQPITDMDFGRTFVALDPDGHRIRVHRIERP